MRQQPLTAHQDGAHETLVLTIRNEPRSSMSVTLRDNARSKWVRSLAAGKRLSDVTMLAEDRHCVIPACCPIAGPVETRTGPA